MFGHVYLTAVSSLTLTDGDRFGDDIARRVVGEVDHLRAGVLVLSIVGKRYGEYFAARASAFEHNARVFHCEAGANVAVDPFDFSAFVGHAAFGD